VRIAVDTNVLVRYLTWDDEGQAIEAANAIEGAEAIVVPTLVAFDQSFARLLGPDKVMLLGTRPAP